MDSLNLTKASFSYKTFLSHPEPHSFFNEVIRQHGNFIHLKGPVGMDSYIVNHPDLVKSVLKETNTNYDKESLFYTRLKQLAKTGLLSAEGSDWAVPRKLLQPLFTRNALRRYFSVMKQVSDAKVSFFEDRIGQEIDFLPEMSSFALQIALESLLNRTVSVELRREMANWTLLINEYCAKMPYPIISKPWFPTPHNIRTSRALKKFEKYIEESIEQYKDDGVESVLSTLIKAKKDGILSQQDISSQLLTMIIGGHETTSTTLVWIFYVLATHPDVEKNLLNEIELATAGNTVEIAMFSKMPYLKAVIEEAMRLYPPIWFENRNTKRTVSLGGVTIPKGKLVIFSRFSMQRDPNVWEDPELFKPERFLGQNDQRHKYASVPFGGGPRFCIGNNFAMMEMMCFLASILPKLKFELSENYKHILKSEVSLFPKFGLPLKINKRS